MKTFSFPIAPAHLNRHVVGIVIDQPKIVFSPANLSGGYRLADHINSNPATCGLLIGSVYTSVGALHQSDGNINEWAHDGGSENYIVD